MKLELKSNTKALKQTTRGFLKSKSVTGWLGDLLWYLVSNRVQMQFTHSGHCMTQCWPHTYDMMHSSALFLTATFILATSINNVDISISYINTTTDTLQFAFIHSQEKHTVGKNCVINHWKYNLWSKSNSMVHPSADILNTKFGHEALLKWLTGLWILTLDNNKVLIVPFINANKGLYQ